MKHTGPQEEPKPTIMDRVINFVAGLGACQGGLCHNIKYGGNVTDKETEKDTKLLDVEVILSLPLTPDVDQGPPPPPPLAPEAAALLLQQQQLIRSADHVLLPATVETPAVADGASTARSPTSGFPSAT